MTDMHVTESISFFLEMTRPSQVVYHVYILE